MPPRYAYWTIIVDDQPTAFRAGAQEELMPTFKRLKEKHPSATMMWFQNGKLWPSRIDAQEAMRARGEMGRRGDSRQAGSFRDRKRNAGASFSAPDRGDRKGASAWKPKGSFDRERKPERRPAPQKPDAEGGAPRRSTKREGALDWKPKGEFTPAPKRAARPDWKPSGDDTRSAKPEWKPKGSFTRERKPDWKPKGSFDRERKPDWRPKPQKSDAEGGGPRRSAQREGALEWKPKGSPSDAEGGGPRRSAEREGGPPKRAWVPKAEYKKSLGIEAKRDDKWRPGGEHRDPKQKYKDAKKAKWSKFKKTIRTRWESKTKKKP